MAKTSNLINHKLLRSEHQRHVRRINDIYIEAQLSVRGLREVLQSVDKMQDKGQKRFGISAPSIKGKERNIYRDFSLVRELINDRIGSKEYVQSIVFAVALVESYISSSLANVIRAYPQKLLISAKGNEVKDGAAVPVDVRDIVNATSLDALIAEKADQRVRDAGYATPASYFAYCTQIFGFEFGADIRRRYIEIKATRDIHVHNDGIANQTYLGKASDLARANEGDPLLVDSEYFGNSIYCLKQILAETYGGLKKKYGRSLELNRILTLADEQASLSLQA